MKYEAVFGDQRLFKDCSENAILVISDLTPTAQTVEFFSDDKLNFETVDVDSRRIKVAMRRIIAEPKRWTWEDKKAGRLPDVGCLIATIPNFDCTVVGVDEERKNIAIQYENGKLDVVRVHCVSPIETPEEKTQREEDEFIDSLRSVEIHGRTVGGYLNQGARTTYRKLKGGE